MKYAKLTNMKALTKQEAIQKAGGAAELARLLGISQSAVSQWAEEIPDKSLWKISQVKPEWLADASQEKKKEA